MENEKIKSLEGSNKKELPLKATKAIGTDNIYGEEFILKVKDPIKEKHKKCRENIEK